MAWPFRFTGEFCILPALLLEQRRQCQLYKGYDSIQAAMFALLASERSFIIVSLWISESTAYPIGFDYFIFDTHQVNAKTGNDLCHNVMKKNIETRRKKTNRRESIFEHSHQRP
ncbi:hypothetical protein NPIL_175191 [Nephila pilipes]|uniref:Uncharacterized protein n=1 Tax=Nephila pilipes TaxID=299642 RepID=A0A8X6TVU1_NEPPI|nr:hypothetical protein NPIL_175191 [Nephila pilipes]